MSAQPIGPPALVAEPGMRLAIGLSGSGKSYKNRHGVYRAVAAGMPVIVLDQMAEWTSVPRELAPHTIGVASMEEAEQRAKEGARLIILPEPDVAKVADRAAQWAIAWPGTAGLAIPEAHMLFPNGDRLAGPWKRIATQWRHPRVNVALWLDTQRIVELSRTLADLARETCMFAISGERDLARVREWGGRELETAVKEAAQRYRAGEPGWHVRINVAPIPPYHLERES